MILYEYYCLKCERVYTALADIKDRDKAVCPKCGEKLKRHFNKVHLSSKRCTFGY